MQECIAWDIETCPLPDDSLQSALTTRKQNETEYRLEKEDLTPEEAANKSASLHPFLGWICCISAVRGNLDGRMGEPTSWTAASPDEEEALLRAFWQDIGQFKRGITWVTFNGKRFDAPFIELRSAVHGLQPSRTDLLDTYPYKHRPHADLSNFWPQYYSLEDLCELLNVENPKLSTDGSGVYEHIQKGEVAKVQAYCEQDVVASLQCLAKMPWMLG